jgi:hypothetical protein
MPAIHKVNEHLRKALNTAQDAKGPLGGTPSDFAYMASMFHQTFREAFKLESYPLYPEAVREEMVRADALLERIALQAQHTAAQVRMPALQASVRPFVPGDVVRHVNEDHTLTVGGASPDGVKVVFIDGAYAQVREIELVEPATVEKQRLVIAEMLKLPENQARHSWAKAALEKLEADDRAAADKPEESAGEGGKRRRKAAG